MNLLRTIKLKHYILNKKIAVVLFIIFTFIISNINLQQNIASNFSITKRFPKNINGWIGQNLKIEEESNLFKVISSDDIILKFYKKSNCKNEINMALILADNKKKVHDPQICYKLQGFEFLNAKKIKLSPDLKVNFIETKKAAKKYLFIYWYTDLDDTYATRAEFWSEIIYKKIFNKPIKTYGIVILYTPIENTENLKKFALEVNKILFKQIKKSIL